MTGGGGVSRALRLLVLPTSALLVVAAFLPGRLAPGVRVYALIACGIVLWLALGAMRRAFPPAGGLPGGRPRPTRRPAAPRGLAELENVVALGLDDSLDLHVRLRPRLRALAASLLESRRGVALDDQPETARELLGDETWELVRPDRPAPDGRARGPSPEAFDRVVGSLERL